MDVLVSARDGTAVTLSSIGFKTLSFEETPTAIERNTTDFSGRNGSIDYGGRHTNKSIKFEGFYYASSMSEDEYIQERINGVLSSIEPIYITQMSNDNELYSFERPGERSGAVTVTGGSESHKRFLVYRTDTNSPEFKGKSGIGLLSTWSFEFDTVELPYGESKPYDLSIVNGNSVPYAGNTANSQLEQPFYFEVTANAASTTGFILTLDSQVWEVRTPVVVGDVFKIAGMSNYRGSQNINDETNYGYFIFQPSKTNKVTCSISAKIIVRNLKDLYR